MSYRRKLLYEFKTKDSTGLDLIPTSAMVVVIDYNGKYTQFIKTGAIEADTTIENAISDNNLVRLLSVKDGELSEINFTQTKSDKLDSTDNPHGVTKAQVGLDAVDNTADVDKPVSTAQQDALDLKVDIANVIDDLTHTDTDKPLSANQGKILNEAIVTLNGDDTISGSVDTKVKVVNDRVTELKTTSVLVVATEDGDLEVTIGNTDGEPLTVMLEGYPLDTDGYTRTDTTVTVQDVKENEQVYVIAHNG